MKWILRSVEGGRTIGIRKVQYGGNAERKAVKKSSY